MNDSSRSNVENAGARFSNRQAQIALAVFSAVIIVIGLSMLADRRSRVAGAIFSIWGIGSLFRALNSSDVILEVASVRTRSIVRTRRFPLADLVHVEVKVGRTGMNGFGREYLAFHLKDGREFGFKEFNSKPSGPGASATVVQRAAAAINARLGVA